MDGSGTPLICLLKRCREAGPAGLAILALFALCACLAGCARTESGDKEVKASSVRIMVVGKKVIKPYIEAIGTLMPNDEVTISSEVNGIIKEIQVDEGSHVSPGMLLARVDDTSYKFEVANASASVRQAEAGFQNLSIEQKRKEALFQDKLVTVQQIDDINTRLAFAEQDLDRARVALSLAQEMLAKTAIKAPKAGIVKTKLVTSGDFIRASMPMLSIVQINPLKLTFTVTEKDVGSLKAGQEILFTVDPFPGKEFGGRISVIYPSLEERTRTLKVEALVPNGGGLLKPGFFARLRIYTGRAREVVAIPATSVLFEGSTCRAFIRQGNKAREVHLELGVKHDDLVEVLKGLKGGEKLIVVGQNGLSDGDEVFVEK